MMKGLFVATKCLKNKMKLSDKIIKIVQLLSAPKAKQAQQDGANQECSHGFSLILPSFNCLAFSLISLVPIQTRTTKQTAAPIRLGILP